MSANVGTSRPRSRRKYLSLPPPALLLFGSLAVAVIAGGPTFGCAGQGHKAPGIGASSSSGGAGDDGGTAPGPSAIGVGIFSATCDGKTTVDWSPVRRISRVEYDDTAHDLLGDTTKQAATSFVSESPLATGVNFDANTYTGVGATDTTVTGQYLTAAETLAATAVGNATTLQNVFNLNGVNSACSTQGDACAQAFINAFANSAFRGQFDSDEGTSLFQNVYTPIKAQFDFTTGIQAVITAVLTSPRFLYVLEFGQPSSAGSNVVALTPTELAARLALFLWRSAPDGTLLDAAANNQLVSTDDITQQATRMLADPRALNGLDDFTAQWMEITNASTLTKDSQYTTWNTNSPLAAELVGETLITFHSAVANGGSLTDLLSSPSSYVNPDVANYYAGTLTKITGTNDPSTYAMANVGTASNPRAGILTDAIVLAAQSHTSYPSPTLRGKLVREQVLCDPIQPPPAGLVIGPPPATVPANASVKDQYAEHTTPGSVCANCHNLMDPIGDGFGNYDATGTYQTTEVDGRAASAGPFPPIDPTGAVNTYDTISPTGAILQVDSSEFQTTFTGPVDLATQLSSATQVRQCFTLQQFRYALSRIESADDACSLQSVYSAFSSSNFTIQQVLLAIVQSDAFRFRTVVTPGSACQ
jgi:Protein of unknown function (DUF1592)/Protein of unknown function (DUF1588)/Protein of unknown function (DUF1585)/Protein of unknown function (DUF1595)/Protein of unknown function (DUF1587)